MDKLLIVIVLAWLGMLMGSFAAAQVWRLRARQLIQDNEQGEAVDKKELKRLSVLLKPATKDRSECLHCRHTLAWYDLIPLLSWISLGGKCRYCRKPIGIFEPLMELGLATVFVVSYLWWAVPLTATYDILQFGVWLIACVVMAMLFAYDVKWFLLPFGLNVALICLGVVYAVIGWLARGFMMSDLWSLAIGIGLLGGLYLVFSIKNWAGMGDGILGIGLALFLGGWQLAFLTLFLANVLGCMLLVPLAWQKKLHRQTHIPFGPFLIGGAVIALLWGDALIALALRATGVVL